jgi:hypothetical protein
MNERNMASSGGEKANELQTAVCFINVDCEEVCNRNCSNIPRKKLFPQMCYVIPS